MLEIKTGTELRGRYVVGDYIGGGGHALVWRATDKQLGRDIAIKRLTSEGGEKERLIGLIEEARRTVRLGGHQNIVQVYDVIEENGEALLVMEYVDGGSLESICKRHIRQGTWLDQQDALDIWKQVLDGLVFAHKQGLYHRDIKPSNIMVSKLGVVKLVDFGLAKTPDELQAEGRMPTGFFGSGTLSFMSPEQANGEVLDQQTDIFSAGIVGYILLTGRHPFNHPSGITSEFELIKEPQFNCAEPVDFSGALLRESVRAVLVRMLRKNKGDRYKFIVDALTDFVKQPVQECSSCGATNSLMSRFCSQCGQSLEALKPSPAAVEVVSADQARTPSAEEQRAEATRPAQELQAEGFRLAQQGTWDAAIVKYQEAIRVSPDYGLAYTNLGFALNRTGHYTEAIEALSKASELTDVEAHLSRIFDLRGFSKMNLRNYEDAIADFSRALSYISNNARTYLHRAQAYAEVREYSRALQDVNKALRVDPENYYAIRLKRTLEDQGTV